jgi:hypothetical protein
MPKLGRKHPCAGCPWLRKSLPGYLGDDNPEHFYRASVAQESPMPCHEQIDYSDPDWLETQYPEVDLCAGNLIYFRNHLKTPRRPELAEAVREVESSPHVFQWAEEFMAHHAPGENVEALANRAQWPFDPETGET